MALFQLFITILGLHSISAKVDGDLNHHNDEFEQEGIVHVRQQSSEIPLHKENLIEGQSLLDRHRGRGVHGRRGHSRRGHIRRGRRSPRGRGRRGQRGRSTGKRQLRQVVIRKGTRIVVKTGRFRGQVIRTRKSGGRKIIVGRAHWRRQRAVRGANGGGGKIIVRTVRKRKGYNLIKTVSKSSGTGWTRKVIVTNKNANAAKKNKWWKKKKGNYKPFKWKVRAMKLKVREFRGGYVRFRGKWFVSKNGRIVRPNKKSRAKLAKKLEKKFARVLRKIRKNKRKRFFRKLKKLTNRQLGRAERRDEREIQRIRRLMRKVKLARRFKQRKMTLMKQMHYLRDVIAGLRNTLDKARQSPCIRKNYKHLRHLKHITCSNQKLRWLSLHGKSWATKELRKRNLPVPRNRR